MEYPTDPDLLERVSEDGWQSILTQLENDPNPPVPRRLIAVPPPRREVIMRMIEEGHKLTVIARECKVSISLVCRIKKGER